MHHKLAVFRGERPGLCHMNFQVATLDDVFRNWHFLVEHGVEIEMGPGRHPQSTAVFLYFLIPALSQDRRVIAPDQLGFGGTATGEQRSYGRAAWTEHALALLDALGTGPVDIIGNSMGGAIALSLAIARPGAVRRIVLMGSMGVAMALPAGLSTVWGYTPGMAQMREVIGLFAHDRGLITDELIELRYQASLSPAVRDSWAAMFPEPRQRWVDDLALSGAELAAIGVPVLLVHGRDDRVVPWRVSSAQLADLLPDSRLHVLSGCGHWTMIEKTADFLAVVQPFLSA